MSVTVRPLHPALGAEVAGVDLSRPLDDAAFAAVRRAFDERSVLVFRDQDLRVEDHLAFSRRFGPLEVHILEQFHLPGHPEVLVLSNARDAEGRPLGLEDAGRYWHTDVSFTARPSMGSLLYALDVPPEGGDTLFASARAAYEALPAERQARLAGLRALHGLDRTTAPKFTDAQLASVVPVAHPLVRTHPAHGRKAIYGGAFARAIEGMADAAARPLLDELLSLTTQDRFVYRHRWRQGDLVMWDNRSVLHRATPFDPGYRRHMHRTTVAGEVPV